MSDKITVNIKYKIWNMTRILKRKNNKLKKFLS